MERQKQFGFAVPESTKLPIIVDMLQRGETITHIAAVVDWSKSRVHRIAQQSGLRRRRQWITDELRVQVERHLAAGKEIADISREMCLSLSAVRILRRKRIERGLKFKARRSHKRKCEACGAIVNVWPCVACAARDSKIVKT